MSDDEDELLTAVCRRPGCPWRKYVLTFHLSGHRTAAPRRTLHLALTRQVAA
jgi:hypothetical protein